MADQVHCITGQQAEQRLGELRRRIDEVDAEIVALLNRRAGFAIEVGEVKKRVDAPVYRPEREAQIMARLREGNPGPLPVEAVASIYREVVSACRELERRLRVAYLGPPGTFSEIAMLRHFGGGIEPIACPSFDEIFRAVEGGTADFGVVPVENSTEGVVNRSLDLLLASPLTVSGEVMVPVRHDLMTLDGTLEGVSRVCAHPQALAQCQGWLDRHAFGLERVPVASNAEGARLASLEARTAAIAADVAASRYGLRIVAHAIQDEPSNRTRFLVLGRYACGVSGDDQTSLILSVPDRAGAMHALIEPLARHGVSMKRFESRPARQGGLWEYHFHIDLIGHRLDPPVAAALDEMKRGTSFFKIVGSYPRAR
jgi:chorismate mutase/prephenate dehydratase